MAEPQFIGIDALKQVATQVGTQVMMGPVYKSPKLIERLGIKVISGVQFKKVDYLLVRKGANTRRKVVGTPVTNSIGFLTEREMECKLSWAQFKDNIDRYTELPIGTGSNGAYPLSTTAMEATLATYAEDLKDNLFFGNAELPDSDPLGLYSGYHTIINNEIEAGVISEALGNLKPCEAIAAPADKNDTTAWDVFYDWVMGLNPKFLEQERIIVICSHMTGSHIRKAYANMSRGTYKATRLENGNFTFDELPKVELAPLPEFGLGDRLLATIPSNLHYGVDTESNQSHVDVKIGSDADLRDVMLQIQSIQGCRIFNLLPSVFTVSDGNIASNLISGDYRNQVVVVASSDTAKGTVTVNGAAYTEPQEFPAGTVLTLRATATSGNKLKQWSNGKTDNEIQVVTTGMPMAITAIFGAN